MTRIHEVFLLVALAGLLVCGSAKATLTDAFYSVGDTVWVNTDGDAVQDAGEPGIAGATMNLYRQDAGGNWVWVAKTTTSSTTSLLVAGKYWFTGLTPGYQYRVTCSLSTAGSDSYGNPYSSYLANYEYDTQNAGPFDGMTAFNDTTVPLQVMWVQPKTNRAPFQDKAIDVVDFGFVPPVASVGDRVFTDEVPYGEQAAGDTEVGMAGITLTLTGTVNGQPITPQTDVTDANGYYLFENLQPGTYTVTVTTPMPTLVHSYEMSGDLDGDLTNGASTVTLAAGDNRRDVDFGYHLGQTNPIYIKIGDLVWVNNVVEDANQDAGEVGIPGATVVCEVSNAEGGPWNVVGTQFTDSTGWYEFGTAFKLLPGKWYRVTVTLPAAYEDYSCNYDRDGDHDGVSWAVCPSNDLNFDFGYIYRPPNDGFETYTPGGWGAPPSGNNAGSLLLNNWSTFAPKGEVVVGLDGYTLTFSSQHDIEVFLPTGGTPGVLNASYDPPTGKTSAGEFAGQVVSMKLSVLASDAALTREGLGDLVVADGKFEGMSVYELLERAERVLAGDLDALPAGISISDLNMACDAVNNNFDNGTVDLGYLVAP